MTRPTLLFTFPTEIIHEIIRQSDVSSLASWSLASKAHSLRDRHSQEIRERYSIPSTALLPSSSSSLSLPFSSSALPCPSIPPIHSTDIGPGADLGGGRARARARGGVDRLRTSRRCRPSLLHVYGEDPLLRLPSRLAEADGERRVVVRRIGSCEVREGDGEEDGRREVVVMRTRSHLFLVYRLCL
ncbi:hypothetical protein BDY24DRAFT_72879 [Mrakia frigida]|uniref:uncharacterized protein n=1 Tax=Mrakia frigida TaxID=29902 RepID=UPI003FCBF771